MVLSYDFFANTTGHFGLDSFIFDKKKIFDDSTFLLAR